MKNSAVSRYLLLDRDGVINRRIVDGYVTSWEEFQFLPRTLDALRLLAGSGYRALVVSNQACVSKGLISPQALAELTRRFVEEVEKNGGHIDGVYYCPHQDRDGCDCRKPKPGLLLQARREHRFAFADTFLVGDSERDLMAAHQVGCPAILVAAGKPGDVDAQAGPYSPRATVPDLYEAVQFVVRSGQRGRGGYLPLEERGE